MRWGVVLIVGALTACGPDPIAVATLDWSAAPAPTAAPSTLLPRLHLDGTRLMAAGNPVRLRGVNVCSLEFDRTGKTWAVSENKSTLLASLADPLRWNVNVVRVPVNQQWFNEDDAYVALIETLIDDANARGVYVMLEVQWEVGRTLDPYHANILELPTFGPGNTTEAFWLKASSRWNNRTNLLYDLINEPHGHSDTTTAQHMQELVTAIRRRDPQQVIVIAGMDWAHTVDFYRERPLTGGQLIYSAHQYAQFDPPDAFPAKFLNAAAKVPVIIGEFTAETGAAPYAERLVTAAEAGGVNGWMPWAIGCGFTAEDHQGVAPFGYLAGRMRALNPLR